MKLFNFDHGILNPTTFQIGPYRIDISAAHCNNLDGLPRRPTKTYTYDGNGKRIVTDTPKSPGAFLETADAQCNASSTSILFPDIPGATQDYDLILLLSFLTGRHVYTESDLDWDARRDYADRLIISDEILRLPSSIWQNLSFMSKKGISEALSCVVLAAHAPDLIGRGAYASAALDTVCTAWAKVSKKTKYDNQATHDRAIQKIINKIEKSLYNKVRKLILTCFPLEGIPNSIAEDIWARFRVDSVSSPSALLKMRWFLQALDLFPSEPTSAQEDRLKRLNTVRNGIVHGGAIRNDKKLGYEATLRVAGAVVLLIQHIVEFYIATNVLDIHSYNLEVHKKDIKEFFELGTFRGQQIFTEAYCVYIDRLEEQWVKTGNFKS